MINDNDNASDNDNHDDSDANNDKYSHTVDDLGGDYGSSSLVWFWNFFPSVTLNPTGALESLDEVEPHSQSKILNNSLRYTRNVDKYGPGMRNF